MTEELNEKKVSLVDQVDVNVSQDVEDTNGHPTNAKRCHHQAHQAKGLAFAHALGLRLTLSVVSWYDAIAKFDGNAQV